MKIMVLFASAGQGHAQAATAITAALRRQVAAAEVRCCDALDFTTPMTRWLYPRCYMTLIQSFPRVWGLGYWLFDRQALRPLVRRARRIVNACQARRLVRMLEAEQPDVVVCTHFLPLEVATAVKRAGRLRAKIVRVITDFAPHAFWLASGVDATVVAFEATAQQLIGREPDARVVRVLGIPVAPAFERPLSQPEARRVLGLPAEGHVVLLMGGGAGVGPLRSLTRALMARWETAAHVVVICGENAPLRRQLDQAAARGRWPLTTTAFVSNVDQYMAAADLMISKAGGLTCVEALACGCPLILLQLIPGQEGYNARLLFEAGAAVVARGAREAAAWVDRLRATPTELALMRKRAQHLGRPRAAAEIAEWILELGRHADATAVSA